MAIRRKIVAGNWKMHKTHTETGSFVDELRGFLSSLQPNCEVVLAPPFTAISAAVNKAEGSVIKIAGQNLYWEDSGAFTGEISGQMLRAIGCTYVIIGHSERRQFFGDTDETVNLKIKAAVRSGLIPIFCIGESLTEREDGRTFDVVSKQLTGGCKDFTPNSSEFVIAYEPVWAIGTGKTASPEQAQEVHAFIRNDLKGHYGSETAESIRILYGGSVKPENSNALMSKPDIDGGLIGGASLKVSDFVGIIREGT